MRLVFLFCVQVHVRTSLKPGALKAIIYTCNNMNFSCISIHSSRQASIQPAPAPPLSPPPAPRPLPLAASPTPLHPMSHRPGWSSPSSASAVDPTRRVCCTADEYYSSISFIRVPTCGSSCSHACIAEVMVTLATSLNHAPVSTAHIPR